MIFLINFNQSQSIKKMQLMFIRIIIYKLYYENESTRVTYSLYDVVTPSIMFITFIRRINYDIITLKNPIANTSY